MSPVLYMPMQENVRSGTVQMTSTPTEMVYIRSCTNCELRGMTKLAKCIIGRRHSEGEVIVIEPSMLLHVRVMFQCEGGLSRTHHEWNLGTYTQLYTYTFYLPLTAYVTQELIDCQNVSIFINPRDTLPTVSAERCHSLHLYYVEPKALGSVYTVQCSEVIVHFKPPNKEEYLLEPPSGGTGNDQFVSSLSGEEMVTEKVIRGEEIGLQ